MFGIRDLTRWLRDQLSEEVPEDIEVCEFECRERQCAPGVRLGCIRSLKHATVQPGQVKQSKRTSASVESAKGSG